MKRDYYIRELKECPECHNMFKPTGQNHKYCTTSCQLVSNVEKRKISRYKCARKRGVHVGVGKGGRTGSGKDNHNYKHGWGICINNRARIKQERRYCEDCGKDLVDATHYMWVVHHIDHNKYNNPEDGSNWKLLCKKCHQREHKCWLALEGATTSLIRLPNGRYARDERSPQESGEARDTQTFGQVGDDIVWTNG